MELLGFYDEPYQIAVERPRIPQRAAGIVTATHRSGGAANASARVSALWETTEISESALEWWKPQIVGRRKLGGRRTRLSTLLAAGAALLGLIFVTWSLIQRPGRMAEESLQTLGSHTAVLLETLTPVEEIVSRIGNPEPPDLSLSTQVVLDAESAARQVFTDAGSHSDQRRDVAVAAAGGVLDATRRTNQLLAYRLATERTLEAPALPSSLEETDLPLATEAVAGWRAEIETAVEDLAPEVLPDHRSALDDWLGSLDTWQVEYLDAIRLEDGAAMREALEDLESQILGLRQTLLDQLAEAGGEIRAQVADSRQAAERLLAD